MSSIQVEVQGDISKLLQKLKHLSGPELKGTLNALAEGTRTSTVGRFKTERGPDETKWKSSIRATESGGKTLTDKTILRTSIRAESSSKGFTVGTNDIRAATHQFGDKRTIRPKNAKALRFKIGDEWVMVKAVNVKIPARPFLGLSEEDIAEIKSTIELAIAGEE